MMISNAAIITVSVSGDECFFHVMGDNKKYFDLESVYEKYPQHKEFLDENYYKLRSGFNNMTYELERR